MLKDIVRILREREEGQGLVEYGLIITLVSIAAVIGLTALGLDLQGFFNTLAGMIHT